MPPIIEAVELMRQTGAEALAKDIREKTELPVNGTMIQAAFELSKVRKDIKKVEILGLPRPVLAVVTHESGYKAKKPEDRMMNWIPQVKEPPGGYYGDPARRILSAFGIVTLENFKYVGNDIIVRRPIPPTTMYLDGFLDGTLWQWIFECYDRDNKDSFNRERETLWAIAMLPKPIIEEILKKRHILFVSEQVGRDEPVIASITKGLREILVENFSSYNEKKYRQGEIETNTPVVVFRYHS